MSLTILRIRDDEERRPPHPVLSHALPTFSPSKLLVGESGFAPASAGGEDRGDDEGRLEKGGDEGEETKVGKGVSLTKNHQQPERIKTKGECNE